VDLLERHYSVYFYFGDGRARVHHHFGVTARNASHAFDLAVRRMGETPERLQLV
jgi:hypothetical protein